MNQDLPVSQAEEHRSAFNRRDFLGITAATVAVAAVGDLALPKQAYAAAMSTPIPATLPDLPWPDSALAPVISANTLSFHYGKHHRGYLTNLNALLADETSRVAQKLKGKSLEEVMFATYKRMDHTAVKIYRNAAQVFNHDFYWKSLSPTGGGEPGGEIAGMINSAFGDFNTFKTMLIDMATNQFGTGWAWVAIDNRKKIKILGTNDADNSLTLHRMVPLLTIDVWEHAYYLDYQNLRKNHVTAVVDKLLNWEFANQNLANLNR